MIVRYADGLRWYDSLKGTVQRTPTRDPALWPFTVNSIWNLPIATGATFESGSSTITADLISTAYPAYINQPSYSHPVYRASWNDPWVSVTDTGYASRSSAYRIPTDVQAASGTDGHMHIIDPANTYVDEAIGAGRFSAISTFVSRHHRIDLYGDGIGPQNGVRAYGGSAIGGLIRDWEIDPTHPNYSGKIQHAIAVALDPNKMLYSGGNAGYNGLGYGTLAGYVWPATEQDAASASIYHGNVPMGTYFAIPGTVTVANLGLSSNEARMLATAFQDYGGYVTDVTSATTAIYVQSNAPTAWRNAITASDLNKIRAEWRAVTNNSAATPNGGAINAARRTALAPALPAKGAE